MTFTQFECQKFFGVSSGSFRFNFILAVSIVLTVHLLFGSQSHASTWMYTVKPGDSLWTICAKYTDHPMCWKDLAQSNQLTKPDTLNPGMKLLLPINWLKVKPARAHIVATNGQVELLRQGSSQWRNLVPDLALDIGDRLRTNQGNATLRFADGSTLVVKRQSEVLMDQLSRYRQTGMVDT